MTVHAHLIELRNQFFLVTGVFLLFSTLGYTYRDQVLAVVLRPLQGEQLSYLTPGGGFSFIFAVTMWCGIAAALPVLVFVLYRFVAPALPARVQGRSVGVLLVSTLLTVLGALFGYVVAVPAALHFLLNFADQYVEAMLTADSYLSFVLAYTVGLGALFQIPLVLVIVNWAKRLSVRKLLSFERYVILIAFILAAILSPTPDVVNQCILAIPIILMYQVGLVYVAWSNHTSGHTS